MTKKTAYRGHPQRSRAPVRARNVICGHAPDIAGTRERSSVAKNASIPGTFKGRGINGAKFHDQRPCAYHYNAGMGSRGKK